MLRAIVLSVGLCSGGCGHAPAERAAATSTEGALAATDELLAGLAYLDWDRFAAVLDADVVMFLPPPLAGGAVEGVPAAREAFADLFAMRPDPPPAQPVLHIAPVRRKVVRRGDVALITFVLELPPGSPPSRRTLVWRRGEGGWRLIHLHGSTGEG